MRPAWHTCNGGLVLRQGLWHAALAHIVDPSSLERSDMELGLNFNYSDAAEAHILAVQVCMFLQMPKIEATDTTRNCSTLLKHQIRSQNTSESTAKRSFSPTMIHGPSGAAPAIFQTQQDIPSQRKIFGKSRLV